MKSDEFRDKRIVNLHWVVVLCLVGIGINILGSYIVGELGIVLFLDSIGTIIVALFGGLIPGIAVGLVTNLIKSVSDSASIYYACVSVLIAICTSYFARRGWFEKIYKVIFAILGLGVFCGGISAVITWFLYGFATEGISATLAAKIYDTVHFGRFGSQITADILIDLADKAVSVIPVAILYKVIPDSFKKKIKMYGWQQTPLSEAGLSAARRTKTKRLPLRIKMLAIVVTGMLVVGVANSLISYKLYKDDYMDEHTKVTEGVALVVASEIDGDRVDEFIEKGESAPGYKEIEDQLYNIKQSSKDVEYVYVYKIEEDGCHVVFDLDTDEEEGGEPGELIPFDESFADLIPTLLEGGEIDPIITDDTYGYLLTVYKPIYDSSGKTAAYACVDLSVYKLKENTYVFLVKLLSLFLGVFVMILAIAMWITEYHITLPINSMAISAGAFAYDSEEEVEDSLARIRNLDISTGDEIENLYRSFGKMTEDNVEYAQDLQQKTETIAQMQSALIMILADIVESRDKCTGDHVRKTAAYTKIIMKHMKKLHIYEDQLTDEFVYDVGNSAPLHDVGKIHVPDAILNKPGRLTDEEFAIMKEHTTVGAEILDQAIEMTPDSGYLAEARNLALYHHEKWDGSGYPTGIAGEEIPLSARIMAIADVFDALVSKRSYKDGFPFEKAMDIIKEGAGQHFDAKLVEAFVDAEDEVRKVSETFNSGTIDVDMNI